MKILTTHISQTGEGRKNWDEVGRPQGIWGYPEWLDEYRREPPPEYVVFSLDVPRGPRQLVEDWQQQVAGTVVVGRLSTGLYRPAEPTWRNEKGKVDYAVRFAWTEVAELVDVSLADDGPLGGKISRALRLSAYQGTIVELTETDSSKLLATIAGGGPKAPLPVTSVPAELRLNATALLRRLIGVPLTTLNGNRNLILGVEGDQVVVQTERTPEGSPARISFVQTGMDLLRQHGEVEITTELLGHRSSFVAAVLASIPGVMAESQPHRVILESLNPSHSTAMPPTFPDDETDVAVASTVRKEQSWVRRALIGDATHLSCDLCGRDFPVSLLVAAHIKKRSVCTNRERLDVPNIAMLACKFGCDDLYELGLVTVDDSGAVRTTTATSDLGDTTTRYLKGLRGRTCKAFRPGRASYYAWHRSNVFVARQDEQG